MIVLEALRLICTFPLNDEILQSMLWCIPSLIYYFLELPLLSKSINTHLFISTNSIGYFCCFPLSFIRKKNNCQCKYFKRGFDLKRWSINTSQLLSYRLKILMMDSNGAMSWSCMYRKASLKASSRHLCGRQ
jgi:hypothetical protein